MPQFTWINFAQAKAALAARLQDSNEVFWIDDEIGRYIVEALRTWNALTNQWIFDYDLSSLIELDQVWYPLQNIANYPRVRTVTDQELLILMAYHLIEPQGFGYGGFGYNFGFNWGIGANTAGTGMFTVADMAAALQRRRDEIIQLTACNVVELLVPGVPGVRQGVFPDTTLSPLRARWVPVSGSPNTLWRDDDLGLEYFSTSYLQGQAGPGQSPGRQPKTYGVVNGPPLAFNLDFPPPLPGNFDFLIVKSQAVLNPPNATVLGLPNDWCWVAKWGALSDLLGEESEATDPARADYCLQRYRDGITIMQKAPWIFTGLLNGVPVDTVSVSEMDDYAQDWEDAPVATPCIVTGGMDFLAVSPVPTAGPLPGVALSVVGNAPIPVFNSDFVQISRDQFDVILDYSAHLASFKMGGSDFTRSKELAKNFFMAALLTNSRLKQLGLFRDLLLEQGQRQEEKDPRFVEEGDK